MAQMQGRDSALLVLCVLSAMAYVVGGDGAWGFAVNYQDWASKYNFSTSDVLVFNYTANSHSVLQVSKPDYDSCSIVSPLKTYSTGLDNVPITSSNMYFVCGYPNHCSQGMKIAISAASTPITPTGPSATPGTPSFGPPVGTGPAGNSASSLQSGSATMVVVSASFGAALFLL
ncbi:hypothetical protein O6H91_10G066200 [Diphasiastrum complanatum]|uniref:Uncharacterized protein n=1 Tax=Diphasiastrum complanatum TaxID=34168 RepID=A0ACC2CHZ2_DIPCM|nr:hypothetical protein O6H91_10G066200 [Diphasiastrum complanatum]